MPEEYKNQIVTGDARELAKRIPDESIDLIITSPPYNVGINYGDKGWEADRINIDEYKKFADEIMAVMFTKIKKGGRACFEIGGSGRNKPLSWIWQDAAYKCGLGLYSEIVIQHRKTNPTAWGSYLKADMVFTIPNFHMLYIFYKNTARKVGSITTITKDEFVEWTRGYWKINYSVDKVKNHPATFPIEIPYRCMCLLGHKFDVVCDPFMGSGTTAVVSILMDRLFIGFEIVPEYAELARERVRNTQPPLFVMEPEQLELDDMGVASSDSAENGHHGGEG